VTVADLVGRIRDEHDPQGAPPPGLCWLPDFDPDQPTVRIGHRADTARAGVGPWIAGALASATVLSSSLVISHVAGSGSLPDSATGSEPAVSDAGDPTVYTPAGPRVPAPRRPALAESVPSPTTSDASPGPTSVNGGSSSGGAHDEGGPGDALAGVASGAGSPGGGEWSPTAAGRRHALRSGGADLGAGEGLDARGSRLGSSGSHGQDGAAHGPAGGCDTPGHILNLSNWKLTLPTGSGSSPTEIAGSALGSLTGESNWFSVGSGCAVAFRAPVNGVTTSGSKNPRSELREMAAGGAESAGWSSTEGTHTMVLKEAFTKLPSGKPQVVGGQIHDASDDISVFRLEGSNLYVTDGNNPHYQLVTSNYVLGTPFEAKYVVSGGVIRAYYNGRLVATLTKDFSGAYFKAGAYTQANCQDASPCSSGNYGEVMVYSLRVTHS